MTLLSDLAGHVLFIVREQACQLMQITTINSNSEQKNNILEEVNKGVEWRWCDLVVRALDL